MSAGRSIVFCGSASGLSLLAIGFFLTLTGTVHGQSLMGVNRSRTVRPPPLHIDYLITGLAVSADSLLSEGALCRSTSSMDVPCIVGSGGGLTLRGGYRSPGPWYVGGAYQFSKTNSSNIYRLATLQQLRAEMRYLFELGYRTTPYVTAGIGGVAYGNEWGAETGGGTAFVGIGAELQLSRLATVGLALNYQPVLLVGWTDSAEYERETGLAQYLRLELLVEIRSDLSRR